MTDPVQAEAPKVEAAANAAVATVATDVKAAKGVIASVYAQVKKYAPHVATAGAGYVAGHYTGAVVFAVLRHII